MPVQTDGASIIRNNFTVTYIDTDGCPVTLRLAINQNVATRSGTTGVDNSINQNAGGIYIGVSSGRGMIQAGSDRTNTATEGDVAAAAINARTTKQFDFAAINTIAITVEDNIESVNSAA